MTRSCIRLALSLAMAVSLGAGLFSGCAKNYPGALSPVIMARQRAFGFVFQLKSPGGELSADELRVFADEVKASIQNLYHPRKIEEFEVKGHNGIIDVVDIAYEGAMEGYDDVFFLEGDVTGSNYDGRLRIVSCASGGPVVEEKLDVSRSGVRVPAADDAEELRDAASIGEAVGQTARDLLISKLNDPNEFQMLGVRPGDRMEGIESLGNELVIQAGVYGISGFQALVRREMDEKYRMLNYAKKLFEKVRDAYVSGEIRALDRRDTERIQLVSRKAAALSEVTNFYEDEIAVSDKDFKISYDFQGVNETLQKYFAPAMAKSGFEKSIRLYTTKPVTVSAIFDSGAEVGTIFLRIRYSNPRFHEWLKKKQLKAEGTRVLPLTFFNKLMADFYGFRNEIIASANEFDRKPLGKFSLVVELQRSLYGWAQLPVSIYEGKLRPVTNIRVQLCDYPPTDIATSKMNLTNKTKLYALGTPQDVSGARLPYASIYEFFGLDDLFDIQYPHACKREDQTELYLQTGKGAREKITLP